MYELTVKMPNLADDAEVSIGGLGTFKNNSTTTIDNEQHEAWRAYNRSQFPDHEDQTLLQSIKGTYGIEVTTTKDKDKGGDKK